MEEIKPCIVVIGGGRLGGDKALYRSDRILGGDKALYRSDRYLEDRTEYLEEIKPCIVVIGGGILGGDKALYRSDRRRDTWSIPRIVIVLGGDKALYRSDRIEGDKALYLVIGTWRR